MKEREGKPNANCKSGSPMPGTSPELLSLTWGHVWPTGAYEAGRGNQGRWGQAKLVGAGETGGGRRGCWGQARQMGVVSRRAKSLVNIFFISSHLFPILYYFIGSPPGTNGVGTRFTTSRSQSMGGGVSPCARSATRSPLPELIGSGTFEFVRRCMRHHCLMYFLLYNLCSPGGLRLKGGIMSRRHVTCAG